MIILDSTSIQTFFSQDIDANKDLPAKQKLVLKAALDLFASKGFEATTTGDIAQKADVSQGTVYKRFKTKQQLLSAVLQPMITVAIPNAVIEFKHQLSENTYSSLKDFLNTNLNNRLHFVSDNRKALKIMIGEAIHSPKLLQELISAFTPLVAGSIPEIFDQMKQQHLIVNWPNARLMQYVVSTGAGYAAQIILFNRQFDVDEVVDHAVAFLVKGLSPE